MHSNQHDHFRTCVRLSELLSLIYYLFDQSGVVRLIYRNLRPGANP
jgi:hypothetical protein